MFYDLLRAAAAAIALSLLVAPAAAGDEFTDGLRRPFTLAGGGAAPAVTGASAALVSLPVNDVAPLADGRTLVSLTKRPRARASNLVILGVDGRVESFPSRPMIDQLAVEPSGTVVATTVDSLRLSRIFPTERRVEIIADKARATGLSAEERREGPTDVAALSDGTFAVVDGRRAFRVAADGTFTRAYPDGRDAPYLVDRVAALDGAAFAVYTSKTNEVTRVEGDGTLRRLAQTSSPPVALAAAPAGGLLLLDASGLRHLAVDGTPTQISRDLNDLSAPPRAFGAGDGAPAADATIGVDRTLAVAPDGAVLIGTPNGLRAIVGDDSARRLVALEQSGYKALRDGRAGVATTVAGRVVLRVTGRGKPIVSAPVDLPAGGGEVSLPRAPRPGPLRVELSLTDASGGVAVARTSVDTRRRLALQVAYRTIDEPLAGNGEGDDSASVIHKRGSCRRRSALRIDCRALSAYTVYADPPHFPRTRTYVTCIGRYVVRLRPDGVELAGDASCRPL